MDFVKFYDAYWQEKGDADTKVDRSRLLLLAEHVQAGESVLQVDGGPGWLAQMLLRTGGPRHHDRPLERGGRSGPAARGRRPPVRARYLAPRPLPFDDRSFDVVICDSQLEHRFDPDHTLDEMARVLRAGGRMILLLPNTAHWRVRWWLLTGRFPVVPHSPTDWLHIRFFTLSDMRLLLQKRRIAVEQVDGSASLWVKGLYPFWLRRGLPAKVYTRLARRRPALFARDFIVVGRKLGAQVPASRGGK